MKRWLLFTLVCVLLFFTGGCWDRLEINDMAFVMATGVDTQPNKKVKLIIQLALPTGGAQSQSQTPSKGGGKSYFVESSSGVDIWDTTTKIQEKLSRKVFTAHRRILVIGEKLAERGIQPILDAFVRHPDSRLRTYVLVAKGTTAEKVLEANYPLEKEPIEGIRELLHSKVGLAVDLKEVLKERAAIQAFALPSIELVKNGGGSKKIYRISGAGVFHHDKLAGYLDDQKTRGLIWLRREQQQAVMTVYIPKLKGTMSAEVVKASANLKAKKVHGQMIMYIKAAAEVAISENQTKLGLTETKDIKEVERLFAENLKKRIRSSLNQVQHKYQSDVVGFGETIHRTYPQDWKRMKQNWDHDFPNIKTVVQTEVKVRRTGMTSEPINFPENQIKKNIP